VIRDFTSQTPLEKLSSTLLGYLHKIWSSLSKPVGKEDSTIDDFFDFSFDGLPHKIFAREAFESATSRLRTKFVDSSKSESYVFRPEYHKRIPADGFPHFAESIWAKIVGNKDLDLPTQTQLLAQHRCEEIAVEVMKAFTDASGSFKNQIVEGKVVEGLGPSMNDLVSSCLGTGDDKFFFPSFFLILFHFIFFIVKYDEEASRYHSDVYKKKRSEFFTRMSTSLNVFYIQHLGNLHKKCIDLFQTTLSAKLKPPSSEDALSSPTLFAQHLRDSTSTSESYFRKIATSTILANSDWVFDAELRSLLDELERLGSERRADALTKMVAGIEKGVSASVSDTLHGVLNEAGPGMWGRALTSFKDLSDSALAQLKKRSAGTFIYIYIYIYILIPICIDPILYMPLTIFICTFFLFFILI
jgi:protein SEY1